MPQRDPKLEGEFTRAMFAIYDAALKLKPKYNPIAFRGMVAEHGGREAADRLLTGATPSSGFGELLMRGPEALKLSVEYLVLNDPWRQLFTEDQLEIARSRLKEVGCEFPPDDLPSPAVYEPLPEELPDGVTFPEGAVRRIQINAYERSPEARAQCLDVHGTSCIICKINFGKVYGLIAEGFIHVHHLTPVSQRGSSEINPERDLRPVCPNCHAIIHLGGKCRSIEEVQALFVQSTNGHRAAGLA